LRIGVNVAGAGPTAFNTGVSNIDQVKVIFVQINGAARVIPYNRVFDFNLRVVRMETAGIRAGVPCYGAVNEFRAGAKVDSASL
jgi:hypothetical protein